VSNNVPFVYKLLTPAQRAEQEKGPWSGAPIDLQDGYVHLSSAAQVQGTYERYFADLPEVLLMWVSTAALPAGALVWEVSRGGELFPHLYGPLPVDAVARIEPVEPSLLRELSSGEPS
jgi:uncharacterized protein (DUF952 family)